ncbi:glycosyltransferase [Pseudozobellia sp. WGM2]|uniref:glycosyltransferase n=1 Tax=Pseudozobellia sp. WGM2 TaxID=2787625 RepID=UPI001AE0B522|nr:glycosyltransferase [Pseudozobellia sp. WGM2]
MVTFIIPVKSAKVSESWSDFSKLVERTLKSVTNQTSQNFKVVVVCHEKPETDFTHPNLVYIHVGFDVPRLNDTPKEKHNGLMEVDKSNKIFAGVAHAKKYYSDYLMVVDSDDCISNKLVEFIEANKDTNDVGWYINKGYFYREGDKLILLNRKIFNILCGTCIIVRPSHMAAIFQHDPHLLYVHQTMEFEDNTKLEKLPFPGAVYSMANRENIYMSGGKMKSLAGTLLFRWSNLKETFRILRTYRMKRLNSKIISEFGIYSIGSQ